MTYPNTQCLEAHVRVVINEADERAVECRVLGQPRVLVERGE